MKKLFLFFVMFPVLCLATVEKIKLLSDNTPDWTDLPSALHSMTGSLSSDEQKAIALWKWIGAMRHQVMPAEDSFSLTKEGPIYNVIKVANNFGNSFCVTTNSFPAQFWKLLGKEAREYDIDAHTVCDLYWDGAWHNFDPAFGFYYKDSKDGHILGCQEIVDRRLTMQNMASDVTLCNLFSLTGLGNASIYEGKTVSDILINTHEYALIAETRTSLKSETLADSYTYQWNLKPFESYCRRWTQISKTDSKSFLAENITDPLGANPNIQWGLNIASNGIWIFAPDFKNARFSEPFSIYKGLELSADSLLHPTQPGDTATLVYRVDGANIICHANISGRYLRATTSDVFEIYFSADSSRWIKLFTATDTGRINFTKDFGTQTTAPVNLARTRDHYFIKINMAAKDVKTNCGLLSLKVKTYTVVNLRTLPKLTLGSNRIKFTHAKGIMNPLEIAYYWTEYSYQGNSIATKARSHTEIVRDSTEEYLINTAGFRNPVMDSVRLSWTDNMTASSEGYNDGIDVGALYEAPRYYYTFSSNIDIGKTISALPASNKDAFMVDGKFTSASKWKQANVNPEITIDFDSAQTIAGIRLIQTLDSSRQDYLDSAIVTTSLDGQNYLCQGAFYNRQVWEPATNYLLPNTWDLVDKVGLPMANLLETKFTCAFDNGPVIARYVRIKCFNSRNGLNIPELEVYREMTRTRVINEVDHDFTLPDPGITAVDQGTIAAENKLSPPIGDIKLNVSPNPFRDRISIMLTARQDQKAKGSVVQIFDLQGRMICNGKQPLNSIFLWNTKEMPSGLYVVKAVVNGKKISRLVTHLK